MNFATIDSVNELAREAHYQLRVAKRLIGAGRLSRARQCIAIARQLWDEFTSRVMDGDYRIASRRSKMVKGEARWAQVIHLKSCNEHDEYALTFGFRTYAHRQSADRAAKKLAAKLFA